MLDKLGSVVREVSRTKSDPSVLYDGLLLQAPSIRVDHKMCIKLA